MNFIRQWGQFMMEASRAHARWEREVSDTILHDRKRLIILGLLMLPILICGIAFADQIGTALPQYLGEKRLTARRFSLWAYLSHPSSSDCVRDLLPAVSAQAAALSLLRH